MNPNDPAMMDIMSKVMQDPELMALMQKPEVMQKLQTIMSNPSAAMQYMADPDMMRLMTKLQGLTGGMGGGMGGFGGGMGGMGGFGGMGGGAAAAAGGHGNLKHIRDSAHLERELKDAGSKLVVVDFFTTWCGPCKRIAPVFEEMSKLYEGKAVFVKVDGDQCRDLCAQKGVQGFPTFHFYQNGKLVEQFSGADEGRLRNVVKLYAADADETTKPSPFKHFPLKESEAVSYKDCKFEAVAESMRKFNGDLGSSHSALALTEDDSKALDALAATLNAVNQYHSSQVTPAQFAAVDKLLQWPVEFCSPGLHFLRMLVRHPQATTVYAKRLEERKDSLDLLKVVIKVASEAPKAAHIDLALRTLTNFFGRRAMQKVMGQRYEEVLDGVAALATHADVKVRTAYLGLLINYAILFREDQKQFAEAKVHMLSNLMEVVSNETDKGAIYRALVILGTLIFRDDNARDIASGLEAASQVDALAMKNPADANITQCASEVLQALQPK